MRTSKAGPNYPKRLIIVAATILAIPCLYLMSTFLAVTAYSSFADIRSAPYRAKVAHGLEQAKDRRDQISGQLADTLLVKDDVTDCEYGLLGRLGSLDCQGSAYVVFGTNSTDGVLKRALLDKLHALGYIADWAAGPNINSITSYPDGQFVSSISWDAGVLSRGVPIYCSTGFGSACSFKKLSIPQDKHFEHYYLLDVRIPIRSQEKQDAISRSLSGRKDPRTYPHIDFPAASRDAYYSSSNLSTRQISYRSQGVIEAAHPMCAGFRVLDEENQERSLADVRRDQAATFYSSGSCISVMTVNFREPQLASQ